MRRTALATTTALAAMTLGACGASDYCSAVEQHRTALDDVQVTTDSFTALGEALRTLESEAPPHIRDEYGSVADAVEALLEAEAVTGVPMEDLAHGDVLELSEADTAALKQAYQDFNDTTTQRRAIALDVADDCDITLRAPGGE